MARRFIRLAYHGPLGFLIAPGGRFACTPQPRGGKEILAFFSAFSITGMDDAGFERHLPFAISTSRGDCDAPFSAPSETYCSYFSTRSAQYLASFDCANAGWAMASDRP